jgi:thiosulfate dehydrogenase [quinone] large subunit
MTRVSSAFGIALMILYWMAHMDWPYISNTNNFVLDEHLVYAGVLLYLIIKHAGDVWGRGGWAENQRVIQDHPGVRPFFA